MTKKLVTFAAVIALCATALFANPNYRVVITKDHTAVRKTSIPFSPVYYVNEGDSFEYMTQYNFFYVVFPLDRDGTYFISKNNAEFMSVEEYEEKYGKN